VLFKISFPAEFHAQTAVECAMALHPQIKDKLAQVERIVIETQEPGVRIIDKTGPLANPADRDHCIQYMVAVPLIFGRLTAADYEDAIASDPRIDSLRGKMQVKENTNFTKEYYERDKRHIGNALTVTLSDGTKLQQRIDFPIGHRKRRAEGMPVLVKKFEDSVAAHYPPKQSDAIKALFARGDFEQLPVNEFMAALVAN
jgi:2-methylcitrate dehydratase